MPTALAASDILPLTCTREGTCCHNKAVWLNPWELACLAEARGLPPAVFREQFTEHGIRLKFSGACSQYDPTSGCRAHPGRPLACRLYPLGRERRGATVRYVHEGKRLPCLDGCPSVTTLPRLSVRDYLAGQHVAPGEAAQDGYLELATDLAEGAFVVLFDSGLAQNHGPRVLSSWRSALHLSDGERIALVGEAWCEALQIPELSQPLADAAAWVAAHRARFTAQAQMAFGSLRSPELLAQASVRFFALALLVLRAIGGDPHEPGRRWLASAQARLKSGS